ncbi:uncharacterized protein [Ambystoma mexicanum]|uniref:uncharacterized protein n=1 Tax=Ambystoma mexicanum TaxID=8296 RepID=UPI0037E73856
MAVWGMATATLWGLLLCLLCVVGRGMDGLAQKYQEASLDDIQRDVEKAVKLLNRKSFLPWQKEQINQMVPRLHLGMIELWLEFRRLQEEKENMWRRMNMMLTRAVTSCQEVAADVSYVKSDVSSRLAQMEGAIVGLLSKVENLEVKREQGVDATWPSGSHISPRGGGSSQAGDNRPDSWASEHGRGGAAPSRATVALPSQPSDNAICPAKILHRVSNLTQILNGHTDLLVELYERVTALEEMKRPTGEQGPRSPDPSEGSGDGD